MGETDSSFHGRIGSDIESGFASSRAEKSRGFSVDPTPQQLRAASQQHKHALEAQERKHQLEQATKDDDLRRFAFKAVLYTLLAVLAVAFYLAIESPNASTRASAQGLISTLLGAIGGGVLGCFTGKSGKQS